MSFLLSESTPSCLSLLQSIKVTFIYHRGTPETFFFRRLCPRPSKSWDGTTVWLPNFWYKGRVWILRIWIFWHFLFSKNKIARENKEQIRFILDLSRGKRFWWLFKDRNRNRKSFFAKNLDRRRWGDKHRDNKYKLYIALIDEIQHN